MNSTKIVTFDYLRQFNRIHIKITDAFFYKIKKKILDDYKSIRNYAIKILGMSSVTLHFEFKNNIYHPFYRILDITKSLNISESELYFNIIGFYPWGSHRLSYAQIPRELSVDEFFAEGYALYLAEGDNGSNGKKTPRKFIFTNSDVDVINHMIKWIYIYFPNNEFYVDIINPRGCKINFEEIRKMINHDKTKLKFEDYNKIVKYKICLNYAVIIDLFLALESTIKDLCYKNPKLAAAYIRGMMIGEGTAYFNKSRYVRIEMCNEKEIKYLHKLLTMLDFNCTPTLRSNRQNMWSLYIGAKQLDKFAKEIGFGVHQGRQKILLEASQKVLRINQYC